MHACVKHKYLIRIFIGICIYTSARNWRIQSTCDKTKKELRRRMTYVFFFLFIFNVNKYKNLSVQYRRTGARTIRWGRGIEESEKERENSQWRSRGYYYYLYFLCIHTLYFYAVESKELNANARVYGVTAVVHKYTIKSLPNERDLSACIEVCRRIKIKKIKTSFYTVEWFSICIHASVFVCMWTTIA